MNRQQSTSGSFMFDFNLSVTCLVSDLKLLGPCCSPGLSPALSVLLVCPELNLYTGKYNNGTCQSSHFQFLDELASKN